MTLLYTPFSPLDTFLLILAWCFPFFSFPFSLTGAVNLTRTPMFWLSGVVFRFLRFVVSTSDTPISILRFTHYSLSIHFTLHHFWVLWESFS